MDKLRDVFIKLIDKPLYTAIAGFVIGLIIGLPILGWWLWPVKWKDADASFLRQDLKNQYLCMVVDSYSVNHDAALAGARINSLGVDIKKNPFLFDNLAAGGCNYAPTDKVIQSLKTALVTGEQVVPETEANNQPDGDQAEIKATEPLATAEIAGSTAIPLPGNNAPKEKKGGSVLLLSLLCVVFLLIGGALIYIFFIRNRRTSEEIPHAWDEEEGFAQDEPYDDAPEYPAAATPPPPTAIHHESVDTPPMDYFSEPEEMDDVDEMEIPDILEGAQDVAKTPPLKSPGVRATLPHHSDPVAHFMTTYVIGDDLYDDSFSIDAPNGSFLGECGVGILDTIGVGDPKKVTAFEVWLFDKNDIQTVTKVLLSAHAMNDAGVKQRLASKGELVQIESGQQLLLETATLQLEARVVEMVYGQGALPASSFFQRMTLELSVWPK